MFLGFRTKSLASPDHRGDMKTPSMSPAKSLRAYGIYGTGSMEGREGVLNEDEEGGGVQRVVNRERKGAFEGIGGMGGIGGSMGPLLNGAWAYQT